jgi:hypothetical protein
MEYANSKYFAIVNTTNLTSDCFSKDRDFIYAEFKKKKYDKKKYAITHGLEGIRADTGYSYEKIKQLTLIQDSNKRRTLCTTRYEQVIT